MLHADHAADAAAHDNACAGRIAEGLQSRVAHGFRGRLDAKTGCAVHVRGARHLIDRGVADFRREVCITVFGIDRICFSDPADGTDGILPALRDIAADRADKTKPRYHTAIFFACHMFLSFSGAKPAGVLLLVIS